MAKKLTSTKARKILHDKEVHGHPLTEQQRKFFGAIAGGAEPYKAQIGTKLTSLPSNYMKTLSEALGFPQKAVTKMVTGKYQTPSEAMGIKNKLGAFATDMFLDPLNLLGIGAAKKMGALDDVYKINPLAKKTLSDPNKSYRVAGMDAYDDFVESGFLRSKTPMPQPGMSLAEKAKQRPTAFPSFQKGFADLRYLPKEGGVVFETSLPTFKRGEINPVTGFPVKGRHYAHRVIDPETGKTLSRIPAKDIKVFEPKPHWLRGYKEVKPPKKKQDGGWLDKYDAPQAQNGIEGTMGGLTDVGFNYNGAWGGTMQMGGVLPGAVGFTYARTQSPAPANGPYAKKTKASAQDGKEMTYTWDPMGSAGDQYMLKRTVTPYTSKRDIRRFTQAPTDPSQVNFISNYAAAIGDPSSEGFNYPTSVPFEGAKHWNIDRFIIEPAFSNVSEDLQNRQSTKKEMKQNVLADMYKYFMVQNQGDKKDAWKQAKQFVRKEINPRIKGSFYDAYLRGNDMPLTGLGMGITDAITPQYMSSVNRMIEEAATGDGDFASRRYAQNPVSPSKYKKFGMDWLMNYKGLSRKEAKDYLKNSETLQDGGSMKYYQEGLDFKPKTISQDGSAITTDINDYRRWQDSVRNYIRGQKDLAKARADVKKNINTFSLMSGSGLVGAFSNLIQGDIQGKRRFLPEYKEQSLPRQYWGPEEKYPQVPKDVIVVGDPAFDTSKRIKGLTEALSQNKNLTGTNFYPYSGIVEIYHPPVRRSLKYQPPVKKKQTSVTGTSPVVNVPRRGKYVPIPKEEIDLGYELPVPNAPSPLKASQFENKPTKYTFTYPTGKYNEQKTMYFPSKSALKSFVGGIRDATYQEGADYASATGTLQDGGYIPVDPMGYWNPENVGGPVIIPSNIITMEGVDQPLLGISDTGDVQYMEPGEDYEFDGEYVTEYPVAQKGKRVPIVVSDPKDPRLRAYQDSLALYNRSNQARVDALLRQGFKYDTENNKKQNYLYTEKEKRDYQKSIGVNPNKGLQKIIQSGNDGRIDQSVGGQYDKKVQYELMHGKIAPIGIAPLYDSWWRTSPTLTLENDRPNPNYGKPFAKDFEGKVIRNFFSVPLYKEPVQPVEYRKPEPKQEVVNKPEPVVEKKAPLTDYFQGTSVYAPTPYHGSGAGAFVGYRTPQGDTVFVKPEDYERMGVPKYGREFIESKKKMKNGGVSVNNADAQPLKKLDQLLNFTNYNKPTKGGWLDKYN